MKKFTKILGIATLITTMITTGSFLNAPKSVKAETRQNFIRGADISMLNEIEKLGGKFYDNAAQKDAISILSSHGANYARIKLWVDPYDSSGNAYGGGTNDFNTTLALAKRAKASGMKVLIDYHFSDFWADPGTQTKPKAWTNLTYVQLKAKLYDYVKTTMGKFAAAGVAPDMVQLGNEISSGILWPDGKVGSGNNDFTKLAELLASAIKGVRDVNGKSTKVILHLDNGGSNSLYRWWFDGIANSGTTVDYDIIGLTYYPFWHGTLSELQNNLNDISKRYNKDVLIVETAYAWTLQDGDGLGSSFSSSDVTTAGYPATTEGQMQYFNDLTKVLLSVPDGHGLGFIYWEPEWIPVKGANWGTDAGKAYISDSGILSNPWDNLTLFDFKGNTLPSIDLFNAKLPDNLAVNPGFEADKNVTSTPTGWGQWASKTTDLDAIKTEGSAFSGNYKLSLWKNTAYNASVYQTITGISNKKYTFSAWVLNGGGQSDVHIYAKNFGGGEIDKVLPTTSGTWTKVEIKDIPVTNGKCEIGLYTDAKAGNWCNMDDVMFYAQ